MTEALAALGLGVTPSAANFLLVHFAGQRPVRGRRRQIPPSRRIILRRVAEYGFPGALRMTVGTEEENLAVLDALKAFIGATGAKRQ